MVQIREGSCQWPRGCFISIYIPCLSYLYLRILFTSYNFITLVCTARHCQSRSCITFNDYITKLDLLPFLMGYLSHSKTETIAQISPSKIASNDTTASTSQYSQLTRLFSADRFLQMDSLGYLETPTVPMDFPPRSRTMSHYNEGYNDEAAIGNTSFQYSDTLSPQYSTHMPVDIPVCSPMAAFSLNTKLTSML